jgi:hypothetical protein
MLKRSLAFAVTAAMAVAVALLPSRPAAAKPVCTEYNIVKQCVETADDGEPGADGVGGSSVPGGLIECPDAPDAQCSNRIGSWWDQGKMCYVGVVSREPDDVRGNWYMYPDPWSMIMGVWSNHPDGDGVVMSCQHADGRWKLPFWWAPSDDSPPSGPEFEAAVTASVVANVMAPGLGVFPGGLEDPAYPDASGAVGMPVWLWADDPGPGVASKLTKSADLRGHPIRIEVSLAKVTYDMGDGGTVVCGLGTEPVRVHAPRPSPNCGYSYMEMGRYTVSAETQFKVEWSSTGGRHGIFPFTLTRSGVYVVGEIQVVAVSGG